MTSVVLFLVNRAKASCTSCSECVSSALGSLVEQQNRCVLEDRRRKRQAVTLSAAG